MGYSSNTNIFNEFLLIVQYSLDFSKDKSYYTFNQKIKEEGANTNEQMGN